MQLDCPLVLPMSTMRHIAESATLDDLFRDGAACDNEESVRPIARSIVDRAGPRTTDC